METQCTATLVCLWQYTELVHTAGASSWTIEESALALTLRLANRSHRWADDLPDSLGLDVLAKVRKHLGEGYDDLRATFDDTHHGPQCWGRECEGCESHWTLWISDKEGLGVNVTMLDKVAQDLLGRIETFLGTMADEGTTTMIRPWNEWVSTHVNTVHVIFYQHLDTTHRSKLRAQVEAQLRADGFTVTQEGRVVIISF
jgi:hypothetical protein